MIVVTTDVNGTTTPHNTFGELVRADGLFGEKEEGKMQVIDDLVDFYRPSRHLLFHIGDTMGDFVAIRHAAELGGIGVAFNPNEPLRASISNLSRNLRKRIPQICFVAGRQPDYARVGDIIRESAWKTLKAQI